MPVDIGLLGNSFGRACCQSDSKGSTAELEVWSAEESERNQKACVFDRWPMVHGLFEMIWDMNPLAFAIALCRVVAGFRGSLPWCPFQDSPLFCITLFPLFQRFNDSNPPGIRRSPVFHATQPVGPSVPCHRLDQRPGARCVPCQFSQENGSQMNQKPTLPVSYSKQKS